IPAETTARYVVRAKTLDDLDTIRAKVLRCFEAGALATGAQLEIFGSRPPYAQVCHDPAMAALYRRNAEALGRVFPDLDAAQQRSGGLNDMGDLSLALPSIHPAIGINSLAAVNQQPEFTAHCVTAAADHAIVDGALAMAWTAIDIATDATLRQRLLSRA